MAHPGAIQKQRQQAESMKGLWSLRSDRKAIRRQGGIELPAQRNPRYESQRQWAEDQIDRAAVWADKSRRRRTHQRSKNKTQRVPMPVARARELQASPKVPWAALFARHLAQMRRTRLPISPG